MDSKKEYAVIKSVLDPSFIAIGVRQGDAFFMKKGDRSLLIDGGAPFWAFLNDL